jgi:hypothetical protein
MVVHKQHVQAASFIGLVSCCLSDLALPPTSRVAVRCPIPFRPAWGTDAEAPWGRACSGFGFFSIEMINYLVTTPYLLGL